MYGKGITSEILVTKRDAADFSVGWIGTHSYSLILPCKKGTHFPVAQQRCLAAAITYVVHNVGVILLCVGFSWHARLCSG